MVGSVVPLVILAVVVLLYMKLRKQGGGNQPKLHSQEELENKGQPESPISPTGTPLPDIPYVSPL